MNCRTRAESCNHRNENQLNNWNQSLINNFFICFIFRMQFERNALSPNLIAPQPQFHSSSNLNALKYNLFQQNLNDNYVKTPSTTSSEEGNSPTELNNCRRILEKPPLVSTIHFDFTLWRLQLIFRFFSRFY